MSTHRIICALLLALKHAFDLRGLTHGIDLAIARLFEFFFERCLPCLKLLNFRSKPG